MSYYAVVIGVIAGLCLGFGVLYLFVGLRRRRNRRLNLLFALFALAYAGTLLLGIAFRSAATLEQFVAIDRWDAFFVVPAFVGLLWYVATYTNVRPRLFLWGLTAVFIACGLAHFTRPTLLYDELIGLLTLTLPWGEQVVDVEGQEGIWTLLFTVAQLATLAFIVYACWRQFQRGDRQAATLLACGTAWFIFTIFYEILASSGATAYLPLAETGFLGIAIAVSIQMANAVIQTEEELDDYRDNLEAIVIERTTALEAAQEQLLAQAQETAVSEERSRLARELHDAVTQSIYSATLIAEALPRIWERNPKEGKDNLVKLRQLTRGALAEMRALLFELRPAALEAASIDTLLPQVADAFTGRTRIPVNVHLKSDLVLPNDVKTGLYRIAQEAFNNVTKHANATQVKLSLHQSAEQVLLSIQDNGCGFDPAAVSSENMGVDIMHERAAGIGALLHIDSSPGQGTQVSVLWPASSPPSDNGEAVDA